MRESTSLFGNQAKGVNIHLAQNTQTPSLIRELTFFFTFGDDGLSPST